MQVLKAQGSWSKHLCCEGMVQFVMRKGGDSSHAVDVLDALDAMRVQTGIHGTWRADRRTAWQWHAVPSVEWMSLIDST